LAPNASGETESSPLRLQVDRSVKLAFLGRSISSDGGSLLDRKLDDALGLSCMQLAANAVRPQLRALIYYLATFLCTLAKPEAIDRWSLTSLRECLIKTGARMVRHDRYAIFEMAEAALPRQVFAGIAAPINGLRRPPAEAIPARPDSPADQHQATPMMGKVRP
jgi:hypothetical protein